MHCNRVRAHLLTGISTITLTMLSATAHAADASAGSTAVDEVIVTGTRTTGLKAVDSPAPIEVVGSDALRRVGQPNLIQSLAQIVPSFNAEAFGGDTANLTLSARLRGVSPNDTLVLINGKRRHTTANLHVLGGPYQGAATADLDLIPVAGIERIEVLQDGAAAQYGTDAIAGVVNVILRKNKEGGSVAATTGGYYAGDGTTNAIAGNIAFSLGDSSYLDLTLEHRTHGFSQRGKADKRLATENGAPLAANPTQWTYIKGFPDLNQILGDAKTEVTNFMFDGGYDFGGVQAYAFGTYGQKKAAAYENYRLPNRVIASPVLGVKGTYTTPGELIFAPLGFSPRETLDEKDYGLTGGLKGTLVGWDWDLSTTYGKDEDNIGTANSANASLYIDTHATPTNFYDGSFISTQWTTTFDVVHAFDLGMAAPLTLALGAEHRSESYQIKSGDAASIYKEGGQSYPGFQPTDAGKHTRENAAVYADVALSPVTELKLDAAVRYEHFSDFGNTTVAKLTGRYDFAPIFALRGTVSTGFRAPTLAEEFYSATNVSPTSAVVQLPANSASAALLGFSHLKPEKSTNYSVGFVSHPMPGLSVTFDVYDIKLKNRVVGTGTIYGIGGANNSAAVLAAIAAHGNVLDPTVSFVGVSVFTNGIDTTTTGAELAVSYVTDFADKGRVDWTLAANYNKTSLDRIAAPPAAILPQSLFDQTAISLLTTASPKFKVGFGAYYTVGRFSVTARETIYGPASVQYSPDGGAHYFKNEISTTGITDLDVTYSLTGSLKLAVGANNLLNKRPPIRVQNTTAAAINGLPAFTVSDGSNIYDAPTGISPFGINGGYYYGRITYTF